MTEATRAALERVSQILHDAGWDNPAPEATEPTEQALQAMRGAYQQLLREEHRVILRETLENRRPVEEAGRALGMGPEESRSLFADALRRLREFTAATSGFATGA